MQGRTADVVDFDPHSRKSRHAGGTLVFENVSHAYATGRQSTRVLDRVSFTVPAGTVVSVVGPSGCGKSTLLTLAAGLQRPTDGVVTWNGTPVRIDANHHVGMAFQQPGLFPWMTVRRNVMIGLTTRGRSRHEARAVADQILDTVGLGEFKDAYPHQLSGGMAQRVGIARALALQPQLLLLDEPFAAVDAFTRLKLQLELKALLREHSPTVMLVTHDVSEAILIGEVVFVMSPRPARVERIVPITAEDRNRASPAYAQKLAEILGLLGVTSDADH